MIKQIGDFLGKKFEEQKMRLKKASLELVRSDSYSFTTLPSFLKNDKEFVLGVVKINALLLAYTSTEISKTRKQLTNFTHCVASFLRKFNY